MTSRCFKSYLLIMVAVKQTRGVNVMYVDDAVVAGLIIVALTCVMMGYIGYFAYKHFKEDAKKNDA